ncbi:MAG: MutH/Sau3AI family endonuclease [Bradymonadia bacterium]
MDDKQTTFGFEGAQETLSRTHALCLLDELIGQDLRPLAATHGITVERDGKKNKGWAGQTVEAFLGRSPNSDRGADFGDWELKVVPLVLTANDSFRVKESMAIAMFTPDELETQSFEDSHLLEKLRSLVLVARHFDEHGERMSIVVCARPFDLAESPFYDRVKEDYEEARWVLRHQGADGLRGGVGRFVQPRVKGGRSKTSRGHAFYARSSFVGEMLSL